MDQKSIHDPPPPSAHNFSQALSWPQAFNLLPWRDWRQAKRRRRQQAILAVGCVLALLPACWLWVQHRSVKVGLMLGHEQQQAVNQAAGQQLARLSEHRRVIDGWLADIAAGHRHASQWSVLAYLLRGSATAPVIEKLSLSSGQLIFSGYTTDIADLTVPEAPWRSSFASEYTLREIRGQQGIFHFRVEAPWEIVSHGVVPRRNDSRAVSLVEGPNES